MFDSPSISVNALTNETKINGITNIRKNLTYPVPTISIHSIMDEVVALSEPKAS